MNYSSTIPTIPLISWKNRLAHKARSSFRMYDQHLLSFSIRPSSFLSDQELLSRSEPQSSSSILTDQYQISMMETKARAGASASAVALAHADKQINYLFQKHLPAVSILLPTQSSRTYLPSADPPYLLCTYR